MKRATTTGWLIYRIYEGQLFCFGLYQSKEQAEADHKLLSDDDDWDMAPVPFLGWGIVSTN